MNVSLASSFDLMSDFGSILLCTSLAAALPPIAQEAPVVEETFRPLYSEGALSEGLQGIWRSRGYGWLFHVDEGVLVLYDHGPAGTLPVEYEAEEALSSYLFRFSGDQLLITEESENSTVYTFDRLESLPTDFERFAASDPQAVFDYFWQLMRSHYAFFDLYGIDWEARREEHGDRVVEGITERELYEVLSDMLTGIEDAHLSLTATIDEEELDTELGNPRILWPALQDKFEAQDEVADIESFRRRFAQHYRTNVSSVLLDGKIAVEASGRMVWGRIGNIGYVNVFGMGGFAEEQSIPAEVRGVHTLMDRVLAGLQDCHGIIVDVSMNTGGLDQVQLAIASHFADEPRLAYTKFAADAEGAQPQPIHVVPADGVRFLGPVSLITSDFTVSAAETFVLAMRELPSVTLRGMATRGALSDVLEKRLPNGWRLTLSNEVFLDPEGKHWEKTGVPPEEPLLVYDPDDLEDSHLFAILSVVDLMNEQEH